jgi:pimeloyl-ACP methyl ester carboxylesterase
MKLMKTNVLLALTLSLLTACAAFSDPDAIDLPDAAEGSGVPLGGIDTGTDSGGALPDGTPVGPDGRPVVGALLGDSCLASTECRSNLSCIGGACLPTASRQLGESCIISGECADGLVCGTTSQCFEAGPGVDGSPCTQAQDCGEGLRCSYRGLGGLCETPGTLDVGEPCVTSSECAAPLLCGVEGLCLLPASGFPFLPDTECADPTAETGPFRIFFEVPKAGEPLADFFRLPFPNDIRRTETGMNLDGFPDPGVRFLGGDVLGSYLRTLRGSNEGFSTNPTVYFRFSKAPNFASIQGGSGGSLRIVNITPDSPSFGRGASIGWNVTNGRSKFICHNYVAIHPSFRAPLEPNTTYAVYLTDGVTNNANERLVQDADFAAVIGATRPAEAELLDGWNKYAPLREFLSSEGIPASSIMGAVVFTTMDPIAPARALRPAVRELPTPALANLRPCSTDAGASDDDRCSVARGDFAELHATVAAPIFQAGTRPYFEEAQGGDVEIAAGKAIVQGSEQLRLSITIPSGEMPADGWPVVVYSHGTGGSFRSGIDDGTAGRMSSILVDGQPVKAALVGYDGVQHGPRRGSSERDPATLFFNFANPKAARGNTLQGAADLHFLTYLAENVSIDAGTSPTGQSIAFNPAKIYFFGHSQGSSVGSLFAALEPNVKSAIFSGLGGSLILSLLNKTQPVDIARGVKIALSGSLTNTGSVNELNPVLSILQWYTDPVDPVNFAPLLYRRIPAGRNPLHVLQTLGQADSFSPEPCMKAFAEAAGLPAGTPAGYTLADFADTKAFPVSLNKQSSAGVPVTALMIPYLADGFDGHFVAQRNASAQRQCQEFIGTSITAGTPTVTQ